MAKASARRPTLEGEFLIVSFENDKINGAAFYRSPVADAYRGGQATALVAGAKKFQVYQISTRDDGTLGFARIEK